MLYFIQQHYCPLLAGVSAFGLAFVLSLTVLRTASGHEFSTPFKWDFPSTTIKVETRQTHPYNTQVCSGSTDIASTDINIASCTHINAPYPEYLDWGDVIHFYGDYGAQAWIGFADPYSWTTRCFTYPQGALTGNCNTTTAKVNFGYVYWNTHSFMWDADAAHYVGRHEMGHVFGFAHPSACTSSGNADATIMNIADCAYLPGTLRQYDKDAYNAKY